MDRPGVYLPMKDNTTHMICYLRRLRMSSSYILRTGMSLQNESVSEHPGKTLPKKDTVRVGKSQYVSVDTREHDLAGDRCSRYC